MVQKSKAKLVGYACLIDRSEKKNLKIKNKSIISQVKIKFRTFINQKILFNGSEVGFLTSNDKKNGLAYISKNILENYRNENFQSGDSILLISDPWWSDN